MGDGLYRPKYRDRHGKVRTSKVWWLRTDPLTRRRIPTRCGDREAARAFKTERERLASDPNYKAANETTIGFWSAELLRVKTKRKAKGTAHMYGVKIGHVLRIFGRDAPMSVIAPTTVDRFVEQRQEEGASDNTIGKELTAISQLCKYAKRGGAYPGDIKALKPVDFSINYKPRERVIDLEEEGILRRELGPKLFAGVALILATSCRDSEVWRVLPDGFDATTGILHIPGTKTEGSDRWIPVPSIFRGLLEEALPYLPLKPWELSRTVGRKLKRAGKATASSNDLRRTCATRLILAGVPFPVVSKILGHVNSVMLERVYAKLKTGELGSLLESHIEIHGRKTSKTEPGGGGFCDPASGGSGCFSASGPCENRTHTPFRARDFKAWSATAPSPWAQKTRANPVDLTGSNPPQIDRGVRIPSKTTHPVIARRAGTVVRRKKGGRHAG